MYELAVAHARMSLVRGDITALVRGDITEQAVDAIVNAANSSLLGGGGVDGAIHSRGGLAILAECRELRRTRYPDGLPAGEAVSTTAGSLPARRVIHTVGPVWRGGRSGEAELLASAYRSTLEVAAAESLRSVAFPSISTGAYGYPIDRAAAIALTTVRDWLTAQREQPVVSEVSFVLFSAGDLEVYEREMNPLRGTTDES